MITPAWFGRVAAFATLATVSGFAQPAAPAPSVQPPPLKDAEGRTLRRAPTGHITNYYEDKVPPYTLPDPLVMADGRKVTSAEMWQNERRPEILRLYQTEIYGRVPATAPKVRFEIAEPETPVLDGTARRQHVVGRFGDKPDGPAVNLMLYLPVNAKTPVPVVLHITFAGDPALPPPANTPARRNDMGPVAEILSHGYAYAILRYTEIQPDTKEGYQGGVIGLALEAAGQEKPSVDEWGTISAWTWGLSRIMDYLETNPALDARKVALVGHSRLGKTVLWAGASDQRYALIYSSQGGELGSALARRDYGETVDDMAANYGYQFAGNLQKYAGHWNDLPVDAHFLISLSAPQPVMVSGGSGDQWSDPRGMFLGLLAADPVWRLLGWHGLDATEMPALDQPVATGKLAFLNHDGPHAITPLDWQTFLAFADRWLQRVKP